MKHIKTFEQLNELNISTYRNAADKLKDRHPSRAKELNDFADKKSFSDIEILVHGDIKIKLSDIEFYPDERIFSTGNNIPKFINIYKLNGNSNISDRKSAIAFKKMLMSGDFKIEKSFSKDMYEEYKSFVKDAIEKISINDLYSEN